MDELNDVLNLDTVQPEDTAYQRPAFREDPEKVRVLNEVLRKYMAGKVQTDRRIRISEDWWKLRNARQESRDYNVMRNGGFQSSSAWLHNVLVNKHADFMKAYPEPNILPREPGDRQEAQTLSSILPVILEQNRFEETYSDAMWQKVKTGTGAYKIFWDADKLNGLGDIAIENVNLLNLFWQPGLTDIQKSRYFFHLELMDNDVLEAQYPGIKQKLKSNTIVQTKFAYDDTVSTDGMSTVIECYERRTVNGKQILWYTKYVGECILYDIGDDQQLAQRGLYDHGMYPYVFDTLFPIEGSPCGYGYVDLCRNPQTELDLLKSAFIENALVGARPRYFIRQDGSVNAADFLDLSKPLVSVTGTLGEDALRAINAPTLPGNYISLFDTVINELRETSGNTETATGSTSSGVTAASAIAALQEASGKGSQDATMSAYRAYSNIVNFAIELIRQFYDLPRQFRVIGRFGAERFVEYSNVNLQPQSLPADFGMEAGMRLPVFDIKVSAQKRSVYSRLSQNELALQFYNLGFFNPNMADQALATLDMMEFDGKEELMQKLIQNGTMYQQMLQWQQMALSLAQKYDPAIASGLSQAVMQQMGGVPSGEASAPAVGIDALGGIAPKENSRVTNARAQAADASQPEGT